MNPSTTEESTNLPNHCTARVCAMIGAPFADGQDLGGVELAPQALRDGNIAKVVQNLGWTFEDHGDLVPVVKVTKPTHQDSDLPAKGTGAAVKDSKTFSPDQDPYLLNVKFPKENGINNFKLFQKVYEQALLGKFVLTVGGDHAIASGSISAVMKARPNAGIIWVDAHGDCNTPRTSPSGNYHGMPAAHVLGWFEKQIEGFEWMDDCPKVPETRMAFIALRDLDPEERKLLHNSNVAAFSMQDVDRYQIANVMQKALAHVDPNNDRPIHLSLDIDAVDPSEAPGTGTKARGGLTYREIHYICESLGATGRLVSMDLVEINPLLDPKDAEEMHGDDPEIAGGPTVRLGIELVCSALGKTIL